MGGADFLFGKEWGLFALSLLELTIMGASNSSISYSSTSNSWAKENWQVEIKANIKVGRNSCLLIT